MLLFAALNTLFFSAVMNVIESVPYTFVLKLSTSTISALTIIMNTWYMILYIRAREPLEYALYPCNVPSAN